MSQKQKRWSAAEARRELDAWRRSGAPMARFASKRGYQGQRLAWWLKRLEPTAVAASPPASVSLAPAVITDRARPAAVVVAIEAAAVRVEIDDASAVHPAWIAELVAALRAGAQPA